MTSSSSATQLRCWKADARPPSSPANWGISHWNLRDWKERYGSSAVAAAVEIAALRRELDATRRQNDILKKALAIVAQQDGTDTSSSKPFTTSSRA